MSINEKREKIFQRWEKETGIPREKWVWHEAQPMTDEEYEKIQNLQKTQNVIRS